MFSLNNIKQNVLILSCATLLAGCGGGGTTTTDSTTTDSTTTDLTTTSTSKVVTVQSNEPMITEDSATIEWTPYGYTTKLVEYGTDKKYGSEVLIQEEGTVTLTNLQAGTEYHYRIVSEDTNGRPVVSRDNTFTTLAASTQPIVTDPIVTDPAPTDPIVTDPAPTDPIVTDPIVTDPIVTEPAPTEPIVTDPIVMEPAPTEPIVTDPIIIEPAPICQNGPAMQQGQIKDSISGAGLADVTVTIDGCSTITDAGGYYTLNNIVVNDEAVVNFKKEGYLLGSTKIQIKELSGDNTISPNYLEYAMYAHDYNWDYDSNGEILSSRISVDSSVAYIDTDGNPYNGTVTAELTILDPGEEALIPTFPGGFKGINSNGELVHFESYGLISLSLEDSNNNALSLANNEIATLVFKAIASTEVQSTIPLWYFDTVQGTWIEEGYAELQGDGTYKGEISHLGIWSLNQPIENSPGIFTDRILYPDGTPVKNLRIHAIGENWISTDLSTDENGKFEIEVIPGKEFSLKAYHADDKYGAVYNGLIPAVAPGEIVDNSSLSL